MADYLKDTDCLKQTDHLKPTDHLKYNVGWLRQHPLDSYIPHLIRHFVRQELRNIMAGKQFLITEDQIAQINGAATGVLQTVSDAATAVNDEIAGIPGLIQTATDAAVKKALADAGVDGVPQPADISGALQALANIQGGVHNIAVAAQLGGATAPAAPAPAVSDPATGLPVAVTAPVVSLPDNPTDSSDTPTAPVAAAGTDGSGQTAASAAV